MTNEEAIRLLMEEQAKPRNTGCEMWVALDKAINAIEKQLKYENYQPKYCPNCGAKMDEEAIL